MASVDKVKKWHYCVICRSNHSEGRMHIFTTKHKTQLAAALGKFSKKVAKLCMINRCPWEEGWWPLSCQNQRIENT